MIVETILQILVLLLDNYFIISMLDLLNDYKNHFIKKTIFIIFLCFVSQVTNSILNKSVFSNLVLIIILILYSYKIQHINLKRSIFIILMILSNIIIVNIVTILLGSISFGSGSEMVFGNSNTLIVHLIALFSKIILVLEYLFIRGKKYKRFILPEKAIGYFLIMEFLQIITILIIANNYIIFDKDVLILTVMIIFFLIENVLLYKIAVFLSEYFNMTIEKQTIIDAIRYEKEIVETVKEKYDFINRWNHDLKNMLLNLQNKLDYNSKNIDQSLKSIEEFIDKTETNYYQMLVENTTINYILNNKIAQMKQMDIDIRVVVIGKINKNINEQKISLLINTLLDSVIIISKKHYCKDVDFSIEVNENNKQLSIKVINYCSIISENNNLNFINDLELNKLKKICKEINAEFYQAVSNDEIVTLLIIKY